MSSCSERPLQTIWIVAVGSRGDIQPYIAVGAGLVKSGKYKEVACLTNRNYAPLASEHGLRGVTISPDPEEEIRNNPALQKGLDSGDMRAVMLGPHMKDLNRKAAHFQSARLLQELEEHGPPDLCISSPLADSISMYLENEHHVPFLHLGAQAILYNPDHMILGLPKCPCGFLSRFLLNTIVLGQMYEMKKLFQDAIEGNELRRYAKSYVTAQYTHPQIPELVMMSPEVADVLYPNPPAQYKFLGTTILTKEQQESSLFFGGDKTKEALESFLAEKEEKPIYLGWGSMVCKSPQYMVELSARAVHHSRQRAVILGGVAKMTQELLETTTSVESDIIEYARKNILFVEKAPHEWLFPRVAATVHHGGCGTTTAAMRSGVPTIITPVFGDQFDTAYVVNQLGVGIGFKQQFQKIEWKELGDAIALVVNDQRIRHAAREVGVKLSAEDGVRQAVVEIEQFWKDYVVTGKYEKLIPPR